MDTSRKVFRIALIAATIFTTVCKADAIVQNSQSKAISYGALLKMFADQPDHLADRIFTMSGLSFKIGFAKKQGKTRVEIYPLDDPAVKLRNQADRNYKIIFITQFGQTPIALDPQQKSYAELPSNYKLVPFDIESFIKTTESEMRKERMKIEDLGVVSIDGHQANKIRWGPEDGSEGMTFYFAKDLNNLFIRMEGSGKYWEGSEAKMMKGSVSLSNISLEVSDDLFQLPMSYKKVDFQSMKSAIEGKILR